MVDSAQAQATDAPRQQSLAAKLLTSLAFSTVGAKLGLIGLIPDANAAMAGENLSFGEKVKGVFNGKLVQRIMEKTQETLVNDPAFHKFEQGLELSLKEKGRLLWSMTGKNAKWTLAITGVGTVAGGVLGWVRGGKVEKWQDIFTHPIRSTKLVLGLETPPPVSSNSENTPATSTDKKEAEQPKETWGEWAGKHAVGTALITGVGTAGGLAYSVATKKPLLEGLRNGASWGAFGGLGLGHMVYDSVFPKGKHTERVIEERKSTPSTEQKAV